MDIFNASMIVSNAKLKHFIFYCFLMLWILWKDILLTVPLWLILFIPEQIYQILSALVTSLLEIFKNE